MYNERVKNCFISEATQDNKSRRCLSAFSKTERYERELEKDLYDFAAYQIINMYKTMSCEGLGTLYNFHVLLREYVQWCLEHDLVKDGQNHFLEINRKMLSSYIDDLAVKDSIITREEAVGIYRKIVNPCDAFVLEAAFNGVRGTLLKEIRELRVEDIKGNQVSLPTGRIVTVYDEFLILAKRSYEAEEYIGDGKSADLFYDERHLIYKPTYTIRNFSDASQQKLIHDRIKRALESAGYGYLSINSFEKSGKIHFINTKSKEKGLTPMEYVSQYTSEIMNQYAGSKQRLMAFCQDYKEYLK